MKNFLTDLKKKQRLQYILCLILTKEKEYKVHLIKDIQELYGEDYETL